MRPNAQGLGGNLGFYIRKSLEISLFEALRGVS